MFQIRGRAAGQLGLIVPTAQLESLLRMGIREKCLGPIGIEDAALQLQAAHGIQGQRGVVRRVDRTQTPLRVDVQPDRLQYRRGEQRAQERQHMLLMQVVDAARARRLALPIQQVAEIVQQRGNDQFV